MRIGQLAQSVGGRYTDDPLLRTAGLVAAAWSAGERLPCLYRETR